MASSIPVRGPRIGFDGESHPVKPEEPHSGEEYLRSVLNKMDSLRKQVAVLQEGLAVAIAQNKTQRADLTRELEGKDVAMQKAWLAADNELRARQQLQRRLKALEAGLGAVTFFEPTAECCVCLDAPPAVHLLPCRHVTACANCWEIGSVTSGKRVCPVCKEGALAWFVPAGGGKHGTL